MFKDILPWIGPFIALVALFRPDISRLWQKKTAVLFFKIAPKIEVGLTIFGPMIVVTCTLSSKKFAHLIESVAIELTPPDTGDKSRYEWFVFREPTIDTEKPLQSKNSMAVPFRCLPNEFTTHTIAFRNLAVFERTEQILIALREKRKSYVDAHNEYQQQFEWKPGLYNMTMVVYSHDPDKTYRTPFQFSLTESDAQNLAVNVETICELMEKPTKPPEWNWVYPYAR
jgi:hypothetical protein